MYQNVLSHFITTCNKYKILEEGRLRDLQDIKCFLILVGIPPAEGLPLRVFY